jgi:hypothetical protein
MKKVMIELEHHEILKAIKEYIANEYNLSGDVRIEGFETKNLDSITVYFRNIKTIAPMPSI